MSNWDIGNEDQKGSLFLRFIHIFLNSLLQCKEIDIRLIATLRNFFFRFSPMYRRWPSFKIYIFVKKEKKKKNYEHDQVWQLFQNISKILEIMGHSLFM